MPTELDAGPRTNRNWRPRNERGQDAPMPEFEPEPSPVTFLIPLTPVHAQYFGVSAAGRQAVKDLEAVLPAAARCIGRSRSVRREKGAVPANKETRR